MEHYIIVLPISDLLSEERTKRISEELYSISRPTKIRQDKDISTYLFGWIIHPESNPNNQNYKLTALVVDLNYEIYVHPQNDLTQLFNLFPEVSQDEKNSITSLIENSTNRRFKFSDIIPMSVNIRDEDYMIENGWFN